MYPFHITWNTVELTEVHEDDSYGYVNDLSEIKEIIYKFIDFYICEYIDQIKYYLEEDININTLYGLVNNQPYHDFIFLSIKYFDFSEKNWKNYPINEKELNEYFHCYITRVYPSSL